MCRRGMVWEKEEMIQLDGREGACEVLLEEMSFQPPREDVE